VSVNDDTLLGISMQTLQRIAIHNQYQQKVKFPEISKLVGGIMHLYCQALQFSEMASSTEKSFRVIMSKQIYASVFSGPLENSFLRIHLL
jgi:hypothetical protein